MSAPAPRGRRAPAPRIDRDSSVPLWRQVHDDLLRRVGEDEFAAEFPGELRLVEEYAVSRHTVREALRRLRSAGVVRAERGRTSRLGEPTEIDQPLGSLYSLFASVEAAGLEQRSEVQSLDVRVDAIVAARLGLDGSAPLVFLERLRLADGTPLALDRVWLSAEWARPLLDADFTTTALYSELHRRCGVRLTGGEERIRAVVGSPAERRRLAMPDDVAALAIERLGVAGDRMVEWRHTLVRGDRFAVSATFSGRTGYRLLGERGRS